MQIWPQIQAIAWAQFRIMRNHLPRTSIGSVLSWLFSVLWYGMYAGVGAALAVLLPQLPVVTVQQWLPVGLLGVFFFWQLVPLFTLSSGWSVQLNKLQIYPVSSGALFGIEMLLRLSTAPEMVLVLAGAFVGLLRHPDIPLSAPVLLLLYIPFNLFLSLAIRELLLHFFRRNRFREFFAILLIGIGVLPQILVHTQAGHKVQGYFLHAAVGRGTPWYEVAMLSSGPFSPVSLAVTAMWIVLCYGFARWQFEKALVQDESFRNEAAALNNPASGPVKLSILQRLFDLPGRMFRDPTAALIQKEFQSLLRMPRFRVIFGMACIFGVVIFIPMTLRRPGASFMSGNFLSVVNVYGLLLLGDVLLWNIFGFDRTGAQLYFVTPVPFDLVLKAKNAVAITFMLVQTIIAWLVAAALQVSVTPLRIANAFAASAVVAVFFLAIGNLSSVALPRAMDPTQTFRKQSGGQMQLRLLGTSVGIALMIGFAFLAKWALDTNWAFLGVLAFEFVIGIIVYRVATESAVARAVRERERILTALSGGASPISSGALGS